MTTRRRLIPLLILTALACVGFVESSASRSAGSRPVSPVVSPSVGGPDTRFKVTFRAKNTARSGWAYDIEATGPEQLFDADCNYDFQAFRHPKRGDLVVVKMPRRSEGPWCAGRYDGLVFLERRNRHGEVVVDDIVGRFSFRVTE
jgi:hypothetical protein